MNITRVHQVLHGYRRGHELLAGSTRLPPGDSELVTRLSDLSGTLSAEAGFQSYLTAYPLPGGQFYALAKTWPDKSASREGCVLTHTLLIPTQRWASSEDPRQFASLFAFPETRRFDDYKAELRLEEASAVRWERVGIDLERALDFVVRFFQEGIRPLVWLGEADSEEVAWCVLRAVWPRLRERFSICTFCLQPRLLDQGPFDLMFAPLPMYARFHRFPREHILDARPAPARAGRGDSVEPWCRAWAAMIFGDPEVAAPPARRPRLVSLLEEDPTAIRRFFRLQELRERSAVSPTAAVGMMDLVESLAPEPAAALDDKREVVAEAVRTAQRVSDPEEALRYLLLVSERFGRDAFRLAAVEARPDVASAVSVWAERFPEPALRCGEALFAANGGDESPFGRGILDGLARAAARNPHSLTVLRRFPASAPRIIAREPTLAAAFLRAVKSDPGEADGRHDLVTWLAGLPGPARRAVRDVLLKEIEADQDAPVVAELLRDIGDEEVSHVLDLLDRTTHGFLASEVRRGVEEVLCPRHPEGVRQWAMNATAWASGTACLVAASFPPDQRGLQEMLRGVPFPPPRQSQVVAMFLRRVAPDRYPLWFVEHARCSPNFLVQMLAAGPELTQEVASEIRRVLEEVRSIPVAQAVHLAEGLLSFSRFAFFDELVDAAMRSAVEGFVAGDLTDAECRRWQDSEWGRRWFGQVDGWVLAALVARKGHHDANMWGRGWGWSAAAPTVLYQRGRPVLTGIVDTLLGAHHLGWSEVVTGNWVTMLGRAEKESDLETYLHMAAQALKFAFAHHNYPLSRVVVAAFPDVYQAVLQDSPTQERLAGVLGLYDWDKAKQLREELVSAFYNSHWPPGDLALAATDPSLVRKLFKRLMRKWRGHKYIAKMIDDLGSRHEPSAAEARLLLARLTDDPHFHEDWD